jgi:hypothetical protein
VKRLVEVVAMAMAVPMPVSVPMTITAFVVLVVSPEAFPGLLVEVQRAGRGERHERVLVRAASSRREGLADVFARDPGRGDARAPDPPGGLVHVEALPDAELVMAEHAPVLGSGRAPYYDKPREI